MKKDKSYYNSVIPSNLEIVSDVLGTKKKCLFRCKEHGVVMEKILGDVIRGRLVCPVCRKEDRNSDIFGKKYGKLLVVKKESLELNGSKVVCKCDCGSDYFMVSPTKLRNGNTKSCGCLIKDILVKRNKEIESTTKYTFFEDKVIGMMSSGNTFLIDLDDYEKVCKYSWNVSTRNHIRGVVDGKQTYLHCVLLDTPDSLMIDHINNDPLDNRKCNLRIVNPRQNAMNKSTQWNSTTGVSGVTEHKDGGYIARIGNNNSRKYLGYFKSFEEAVAVRKAAEQELYGEYAYNPDAPRIKMPNMSRQAI